DVVEKQRWRWSGSGDLLIRIAARRGNAVEVFEDVVVNLPRIGGRKGFQKRADICPTTSNDVEAELFVRILRRFSVSDCSLRLKKDRKSTRLNSSHGYISYAVFCLKKKKKREKAMGCEEKKKKEIKRV